MTKRMRYAAAPLLALALLGACSDDDEAGDDTSTEADDGAADDEFADLCTIASAVNESDGFPSDEQMADYAAAAPEELQGSIATIQEAISGKQDDVVAAFVAIADDDVEDGLRQLDTFEADHCGLEGDDFGAHQEVDADANRVDVTAADYSFDLPATIPAGANSFVLTNDGQEAHFMVLTRIEDGHTLQEALEFEGDDPEEAGIVSDVDGGDSSLAAPGGEDEEVMNVDLEAGNYAILCFVSGADGTPHAFMGMHQEFTVQ